LLSLATLSVVLLATRPAAATVPADLCTGNPCTVSGAKTIDAGSVLDFGASDLVFAPTAVVTVGPGAGIRNVQILARSITFQAGSRLLGGGDLAMVQLEATGGSLRLLAAGSTKSRIDLSGNQAGTVVLKASGDVEVAGPVTTAGSGTDSQGGDLMIDSGGAVTVSDTLTSGAGGTGSGGGETSIFAVGNVTVNGRINTAAADFGGGALTISSDTGNVSLTQPVDVSGGGPDGSGGPVDISATAGNVVLGSTVTGGAGSGTDFACGDGSEVAITAGGLVSIGGSINVSGGTQCFGGEVAVQAGLDFTQLATGSIIARGPGSFGGGGGFILGARNATLRGIDLTSPGFGGTVDVVVTGTLDVLGVIDAEATGSEGIGGLISLQACAINIATGGFLDTRGSFAFPGTGENRLRAGGQITVAGQARATSKNDFQHRGLAPILTGTVVPGATIAVNPDLPDCVELAACGNEVVDEGEACDDGNNLSCDGCSADCTRVDAVCGDGTRECSEQCDDGNTEGGDGCEADCRLPASAGLLFPGIPLPTLGCLAEWKVAIANGVINPNLLLPATTQICTDGDPDCDTDLMRDGICTFGAQVCLRVPDDRLPDCNPGAVKFVNIKQPQLPGGPNPLDQNNAQQFADALLALGGEVRSGTPVLQSGPPITGSNVCTNTINFKVAHQPGGVGQRAFNLSAETVDGFTMSSNLVRLWCAPNTSVCGNGTREVSEQCDDGNTVSCDGCTATCRVEQCGNGILECGEQCDEGSANGTPGSRCSATCSELPPELRIPGGGAKPLDCGLEWSAELGNVVTDARGIPKNQQTCTDNDPACDFDPTAGNCRFRLWACLGGDDTRLACSAAQLSRADVKAPPATAKRPEDVAARAALLGAAQSFTFPVGPGEVCGDGFEVNVPAGTRKVTLRLEARFASGKKDIDPLGLKCVPMP
jgi:cysteine-rich repeat protein